MADAAQLTNAAIPRLREVFHTWPLLPKLATAAELDRELTDRFTANRLVSIYLPDGEMIKHMHYFRKNNLIYGHGLRSKLPLYLIEE